MKRTLSASSLTIPGLRWYISALLFLATLISYIDRLTLSVLAPVICHDLKLSNFEYGSIGVWFLVTYSFGQSFFGKIQDRVGTRLGLAMAMCIWSMAEVAHAAARGLLSLSLVRLVLGLGEGGHWPAAIKGVAEWFPIEERAFGMGIVNTGATLGSALAPPLIVLLQLHFGWQTTFVTTGIVGFLWLILWLWIYRLPQQHVWIAPRERDYIESGQRTSDLNTGSIPWRELLKNPAVQGIVVARFFGDPIWWLYLIWLPLYLHNVRGFSLTDIGLFAWIPYVAADAGALSGGWVSGYLVRRGWRVSCARAAAAIFAAVFAPFGILINHVSSPLSAMALISVVLFMFQFWVNNVQTLPSDLFPSSLVASISGLAGTGAGLGAMLFTLSTGWVVDRAGYTPILIASGLLLPFATILLFALLARTTPRRS